MASSLGCSLASTPTLGTALAKLCLAGWLWFNKAWAVAHGHLCPQPGGRKWKWKIRLGEFYFPSYVPLWTQVWIPGDQDPGKSAITEALLSTSILGCWRQILHSGCSLGGPETENKASHCNTRVCAQYTSGSHTRYSVGSTGREGGRGCGTREKGNSRG